MAPVGPANYQPPQSAITSGRATSAASVNRVGTAGSNQRPTFLERQLQKKNSKDSRNFYKNFAIQKNSVVKTINSTFKKVKTMDEEDRKKQ